MAAVKEEYGGIDVSATRPLGEVIKGYTAFTQGDVLFAKITPCMENGKVALVPPLASHVGFGSTEFHVLRAGDAVTPEWIARCLSQLSFRKLARQDMSGSAGQLRVQTTWLASASIPVAPLPEQRRILQCVDELLSDVDAGVAELIAAKRKLGLYRQSLLKSAVEGALTAEWRKGRAPMESQPSAEGEGREDGLATLPRGWRWRPLESLISKGLQNGLYLPAERYGEGVPILRIDDYQVDRVPARAALRQVRADEADAIRYALAAGDLVINRVNSMTHLGKCIAIPSNLEGALFESNMMRLGLRDGVSPQFVASYLGSAIGRSRLIERAKWAVNQASINQQDVCRTLVPLPPADEQLEIDRLLEEHMAALADQGAAITKLLALSGAQRQNILRAAFSGQLVPQDPSDEPASVLLERIRAERSAAGDKPSARRPRKAKIAA